MLAEEVSTKREFAKEDTTLNTDANYNMKKYRSFYDIDGNAYYGAIPQEQIKKRKRLIVSKLQNFPLQSKEYSEKALSNINIKDTLKYVIYKPGEKSHDGEGEHVNNNNVIFNKSRTGPIRENRNYNILASHNLDNNDYDYDEVKLKFYKKGGKVELLKSSVKSFTRINEKWGDPHLLKKIILIQSTWRRYWLRSTLYQKIYIYYKHRTFAEHLKKIKRIFEKKITQEAFAKLARSDFEKLSHISNQPYSQTTTDWKTASVSEAERAMLDKLRMLKIRSVNDLNRLFASLYPKKYTMCKISNISFFLRTTSK